MLIILMIVILVIAVIAAIEFLMVMICARGLAKQGAELNNLRTRCALLEKENEILEKIRLTYETTVWEWPSEID